MDQWLFAVIFCVVLFVYIHIQHQYTTSNDLEVYRIAPKTKEDIEDVMDLRQPAIFTFESQQLVEELSLPNLEEKYGAYEMKYYSAGASSDASKTQQKPLSSLIEVFRAGGDVSGTSLLNRSIGITYRNQEFLYETDLIHKIAEEDYSLRPPMMSGTSADIIIGMRNITTPLIYHTQYRTVLLNTFGAVEVVLIPPKYSKYMTFTADYDNLEYCSSMNAWTISGDSKIKTVRTSLDVGQVLYIPPYWIYSVRFNTISSVCRLSYSTYVNMLANAYDVVIQKYRQVRYKVEKYRRGGGEPSPSVGEITEPLFASVPPPTESAQPPTLVSVMPEIPAQDIHSLPQPHTQPHPQSAHQPTPQQDGISMVIEPQPDITKIQV